jgi:CheY-like chemotaxis protein
MKILIMDDDESIIKMLTEMLKHEHTVNGTTNAESALELLKHDEYDIVFVDYDMPEHDGLWFMRNARLPEKTAALLFTGNLNKPMLLDMFKLGISGYLTKPINIEQIQRHIDFYSHSGVYADYALSA